MAGYRQIHPEIWDDPWFLELSSNEKLLFIYMFSNDRTSLSGLYEISKKQIAFETGLDKKFVSTTLDKFKEAEKIIADGNIYFIVNQFKRHFSRSPKVIIRVRKDIDSIRDCEPKRVCKCLYEVLIGYPYSIDTETHEDEDVNEDVNEVKDINEDVDVVHDNSPENLIKAFCDHTSLKPERGAEKIAGRLSKAGVICEDIIGAADFLNGSKDLKCVSFKSVEKSAIIERNRRKGRKKENDEDDYMRYLKGKYGEFGEY